MTKVAILGATGMLGSMLLDVLSREKKINLVATVRNEKLAKKRMPYLTNVEWRCLDVEECDLQKIENAISGASWIINAVGMIKANMRENNFEDTKQAIIVNSLFPHLLAQAAERNGGRVLQIATDCVYSGKNGKLSESSPHDPLDIYGKTKSLGECISPKVYHIRCSIIGPEPKSYKSLFEWFRRQPKNATVEGYINHLWNGITTLHFAALCKGVIMNNLEPSHLQHIIPKNTLSKYELLKIFAQEFCREDIIIKPFETNPAIDRTLSTENKVQNETLWSYAGYTSIPTIQKMVAELAKHDYCFENM